MYCYICQSVTLVGCDHTVQQKWKSAHDMIGQCPEYLHAKANLDCSIL